MKKKHEKKYLGPVIVIIILMAVIIVSSSICSLLEIESTRTEIVRNSLETSIVTVKNVFTADGIKYILKNTTSNFQLFEPLVLLIISLISIGVCEASGLFKMIFKPFKNINPTILTMIILFLSICSSVIGEYSFIFMIPLTAILYETIDRKPMLGILTAFIGTAIGYGTGIVFNYDEVVLSKLTQVAASIEVDKNFIYILKSNMYIMFISTCIISVAGSFIIHSTLEKKIPRSNSTVNEELTYSKKGLYYSNLALGILLIILIYMVIPGIKGSGFLLGSGDSYIEKLLGADSPFYKGFTLIVLLITMICGFIYGKISGNIKNSTEFSVSMSKNFEKLGYVFVLLFFTSVMISILDWTNLGQLICCMLINLIAKLPFTGLPLIITFFIITILMTLIMPNVIEKWKLASPIIVPLMMKSNITPNFTQFIFRVGDGIGKSFTPFYAYFITTLAFLQKYNTKENNKITVFGTLRIILPTILLFTALWLVILVGWYVLGLPIGPETYSAF